MVSSLDFHSEKAIECFVGSALVGIPALLLSIVAVRWMCRRRPQGRSSYAKRNRQRKGCRPALLIVREPAGPHSILTILALALVLRSIWLFLTGINVLGTESQCLSGMSCAPQVVVTLVNRASAILFFIACSRILPLIGFAAHARAHDYEPGPHAEPARTALVTSLPVFAWDMSHLARDWWLLVLQLAVLVVTLFVDISYERVYAVYLAYQLQVVVMSGMLAASFLLAARPHLRLLNATLARGLNWATCGICCGRHGVCTVVFAALRGGGSGGAGGGGGASRNASTNSDARAAELHDYFQYGSDDSGEETDATSTTGGASGGGGAGSAAAHEKRRSLRMQRMSSKEGMEAPAGSAPAGAAPTAIAGAITSAAASGASSTMAGRVLAGAGQPAKLSVAGLVAGTVQPLSGPYAALAAWCLLMGALQLAKAALFLYTPITRGGKITGLASEMLYPWFFYVLPEALPAVGVLHLLLRGGLFACEGWKCRPRLHRCCRPCPAPKKRSGAATTKDEKSPLMAASAGPSAAAVAGGVVAVAAVAGGAAAAATAAAASGKGAAASFGKGVTLVETVEALPEGALAAAAVASDGDDVETCGVCLYGWMCAFWWGCCSSNPDDDGTDF